MKYLLTILFGLFLTFSVLNAQEFTPETALEALKAGNARYVDGNLAMPNLDAQRRSNTAKNGQFPFATIMTCSDSRVPVEYIFDRGVGDLFIIKVAGNVADTDEIGTIEYGTEHLKTPILLILGHTKCGAVTAVATGAKLHGSLPGLVDNIKPAFDKVKHIHPETPGKDLVPETIKENVFQALEDVITHSPMVAKLIKEGKLKAIGAIYDIETGYVEWLGSHPNEAKLITMAKEPNHEMKAAHGTANIHEADSVHSQPFFSAGNTIYMAMFIILTSIIAGLIVFIVMRKSKKVE